MAEPTSGPSHEQLDAFTTLVLHYLDGVCPAEEIGQLKHALARHAVYRQTFVQICRMQGDLYELFAARRATWRRPQEAVHASATAGAAQSGGESRPTTPAGARPPEPAIGGNLGLEGESADAPPVDLGAETALPGLSLESTGHELPRPPASNPPDARSEHES